MTQKLNSPPLLERAEVEKIIAAAGVGDKICLVGIRGYRKNTMGKPGVNDRNIYDDAIFIVAPDLFAAFNANTDPGVYRKGIATLKPGVYPVVRWKHRGRYDALQIIRDTVMRDGQAGEDTGRHGINFHFGSDTNGTWSEGCQTLPKSAYGRFIKRVYGLMKLYALNQITYILIENK